MFRTKEEKEQTENVAEEKKPRVLKGKKTGAEWNEYMRQYRIKNLDRMQQIEKCKYYKRTNELKQKTIDKYGIYSADVAKILKIYQSIITKQPNLRDLLLLDMLGKNLEDSSEYSDSDVEESSNSE
jgi:hypothetical protein